MIPLRVYLKNFLCHREQEFVFDGHPVWLLHGPNGVGKSAVFDAMLYALFGEHQRTTSGRNAVGDLLMHGESSLRVEFDFEYDGLRYRVWRTRARTGSPKQGAIELTEGGPRPIRDVNSANDLKSWVTQILGLTYDTFVSAVLLRQGAAEKLIDADRDVRRELFRGIIDLERYIGLHASIADTRTEIGREVRALEIALERQQVVSDEKLAAAKEARDDADAAWKTARAQEQAASERLGHARMWEQLNQTCLELRGYLSAASDRAAREAALRKASDRLSELRVVLPALAAFTARRKELDTAERVLKGLTGQHDAIAAQHKATLASAQEKRSKAEHRKIALGGIDKRIYEAETRKGEVSQKIQRAENAASLCQRLAEQRKAWAGFEAELDEVYAHTATAVCDAERAKDALPHLDGVFRHREEFHRASREARDAGVAEEAAAAEVRRLLAEEAQAKHTVGLSDDRKVQAKQAADIAEHEVAEATKRRDRFGEVIESARCSECGQEIDPEHAARERAKLERSVQDAVAENQLRQGNLARADAAAAEALKQFGELEAERRRAEETRDNEARSRRQAEKRSQVARSQFDLAVAELAEEYASRMAPIEADGYPAGSDLETCRRLKAAVPDILRERDRLRRRVGERDKTASDIATLEQAVRAIGALEDVTAAREELSQLQQLLSDLRADREQADRCRLAAEKAERELTGRAAQLAEELTRLCSERGRAESSAEIARQRQAEAAEAVPANLIEEVEGGSDSYATSVAEEITLLEASGAERELAALAEDGVLRAERERQLAATELKIAELPQDARRPIAEAESALTTAEQAARDAEELKNSATIRFDTLSNEREKRLSIERSLAEQERSHTLHQRLADLLGDRGIQLDLVREAERRIVDLANDVLGRLSSGDLRIDPPDPEGERAFDLNVRRVGCCEPICAANLSGGQRFRVAVSLALAICRFANGERRPLESIIIDEGFGSLDREGRMAMIAELRDPQPLGQLFKRVLVVSHQEDFASAFPVGYSLRSEGGITVAEPFRQE